MAPLSARPFDQSAVQTLIWRRTRLELARPMCVWVLPTSNKAIIPTGLRFGTEKLKFKVAPDRL